MNIRLDGQVAIVTGGFEQTGKFAKQGAEKLGLDLS